MAMDQRSTARDLLVMVGLIEILTQEFGLATAEILTPEEEAKFIEVASMLTDIHGDDDTIIAEAKALLREHLDRILSVEVAE